MFMKRCKTLCNKWSFQYLLSMTSLPNSTLISSCSTMVPESIMSLIWNIFHFLRIIPKPGSGCINKIALSTWIILILAAGLFMCYVDFVLTGESRTLSETITYFLQDILIPLQSLLIIKELASLADLQSDLKTTCLYPKHPHYCLIIAIIHFISISFFICTDILRYSTSTVQLYFVAEGIQYLLNFLLTFAARLVIGVAASKLCKGIEDNLPTVGIENIQITIGPMVMEYQNIKTKLSFLLFTNFTVDTILLTAFAYYISKYSDMIFIPYLLYIMLQLSYIVYALDDCFSTLQSSLPTLR